MQFYVNDNEEVLGPQDGDCPGEAAFNWVWGYGPSESCCITVGWEIGEDNLFNHTVDYWVEISEEDDEQFTIRLMEPPPNAGFISKSYRLAAEMDEAARWSGEGDPDPEGGG